MKTKLYISYSTGIFVEGFRFSENDYLLTNCIVIGEIEIDNPFDAPSADLINKAKAGELNDQIKEHKAKINVLENMVKDLLCIESVEA